MKPVNSSFLTSDQDQVDEARRGPFTFGRIRLARLRAHNFAVPAGNESTLDASGCAKAAAYYQNMLGFGGGGRYQRDIVAARGMVKGSAD